MSDRNWGMSAALSRADNNSGYKTYRLGTHRTVPPAETVARVRSVLREMGITRIANVTGLDRIGIPVVMVCRPNSRSIAVTQGKGLDLDAAKASGLMEAVETYHAEHIDHPLKLASYDDLSHSHPLVDVDALPRLAGSNFHANLQTLWIEGRNLLAGTPTWLPYEMVHANYTLPPPTGSGCFVASTNGLASGNHRLEAIVHGIAEVIERDSTSLWTQMEASRQSRTRIALDTIDEGSCRDVLDRLERAEISVAVWDTTTDVGVPAFYCLITDNQSDAAHSGEGAGCHPARHIALLRALTEAVQVRTTYITGARDDLLPSEYTAAGIAHKLQRARTLMAAQGPTRDFRSVPTQESRTFEDDLCWMLERLRGRGIDQVIAVDLTKAEFELPVARIAIPGLEGPHDHDAYLPGPRATAVREDRA